MGYLVWAHGPRQSRHFVFPTVLGLLLLFREETEVEFCGDYCSVCGSFLQSLSILSLAECDLFSVTYHFITREEGLS